MYLVKINKNVNKLRKILLKRTKDEKTLLYIKRKKHLPSIIQLKGPQEASPLEICMSSLRIDPTITCKGHGTSCWYWRRHDFPFARKHP